MQAARSRPDAMPRGAVQVMPGCVMAAAPRLAPTARQQPEASGREVFDRFVELLYRQRRARQAYECCVVASGYVDHSPARHAGRAQALLGLQRRLADPQLQLRLLHTAFDGDIGMVHLQVDDPAQGPQRRVEIYRVANGRIVEHWGVCA